MKKLLSTLLILGGLFAYVGVEAYCTQDGNYCGGSAWACSQYCTGSRYEEPFCPTECPGYQRYNSYNNYYYTNTPVNYFYTNNSTNGYYYNGYYYNGTQYQNNSGYYCVAYDPNDQGYYNSPDYYNYQSYCDCAGRQNCSCGYYQNPNQNNWIPARRCIQWARR